MKNTRFTERDWKLFSSKVGGWQEAYMDRLNNEYIALLSVENELPSEKFWKLEKRVREDKRNSGVTLEKSRSKLIMNLCNLLAEGAITLADLEDFSDELQSTIRTWVEFEDRF